MARASAARRAARRAFPRPKPPAPPAPSGPAVTDAEIARMLGVDPVADAADVARMRKAVGPNADRARVQGVIRTLRQTFEMYDDDYGN